MNILLTGAYGFVGRRYARYWCNNMMYEQNNASVYHTTSARLGQGPYSHSTLAVQRLIEVAGLDWAKALPCIVAGDGREGVFKGLVSSIVKHGLAFVSGSGQHAIHMVHVDDLAALLAVVVNQRALGCFNVAVPDPLSITGWVREIADELGSRHSAHPSLAIAPRG